MFSSGSQPQAESGLPLAVTPAGPGARPAGLRGSPPWPWPVEWARRREAASGIEAPRQPQRHWHSGWHRGTSAPPAHRLALAPAWPIERRALPLLLSDSVPESGGIARGPGPAPRPVGRRSDSEEARIIGPSVPQCAQARELTLQEGPLAGGHRPVRLSARPLALPLRGSGAL